MGDSEDKGVKVEAVFSGAIRPRVHPEANTLKVVDGHLLVCKNRDEVVAAYAPEKWHNAVVR